MYIGTTCCSACVVQILFLSSVLEQVKPPSNRQRQVLIIRHIKRWSGDLPLLKIY